MEMVKQLFSMYKFGIIPLKQRIKHGSLEYQYQEYIHAYIYIYYVYRYYVQHIRTRQLASFRFPAPGL